MESKELEGNQGTKFRRPVKRSQVCLKKKKNRSQVFACKMGIMKLLHFKYFNTWHMVKHSVNVVIVTFIVSFYREQIFLLQGCSSEMGWERVVVARRVET